MLLNPNNVKQLSSHLIDSNEYSVDDEFKDISLSEDINLRDPNEIYSLPYQTSESIPEIAGFNKEKY